VFTAPSGSNKNIHLKTVVDILLVIRSSDITPAVEQLSSEEQNVLIKYLYKGMGSTLGQSHGNGGILLTWFEKTVDITGQGPIIRYMSDRRVV
jgi:actin related protein 2/3 complex subunit 5